MKTALWIDESDKPDADIAVLMRLDDNDYPVWPGFWDGETWRNADASEVRPGNVLGWMHLENAAMILDGMKAS